MSNSQRDLDTVISSQRDLDEHYRLMASEQQPEENSGGSDSDETTDDDMGDDEATDDVGDERAGGAETTDSGAAGDAETIDSGTAGDGEPKKQRKQRRPNRVGATKETFFAVNPQTGLPTHPPELARGYGQSFGTLSVSTRRNSEPRKRNICVANSLRGCTRGTSSLRPTIMRISRVTS